MTKSSHNAKIEGYFNLLRRINVIFQFNFFEIDRTDKICSYHR